ncbi:DUF3857 domain-containing transglutaminase family protein [Flavobacteriaceae bacterium]|jgi:transglutaminase-like putative cysteine protease|nr:DUF3857 domain-containing transglutaminase family protein [Flavobacteriaceae bacterium]MDB4325204.1 DUF3857 domain-containing transglutaminase family protein [Flavobacteriaceae bacterium]MDG1501961.1 DUF3857 domain-containing protein [Ulvibacter sp.]|tara:strand:+ start:3817 stop:5832 length:2016 start_codon:yes stop_codon:yes gene_type:complete
MKKYVLIIFIIIAQVTIAQNYKPGKVSKEELRESQNALYPDAEATILYREYKTFFTYNQSKGFELMTEVFERVKIYKPEGFSFGTKRLKTYNHDKDREQLLSLKAVTYNLVKGSIEKDKLSKSKVFEDRINNYYIETSFTMPNLKPGSIVEYEYRISSPFTDIGSIDLQFEIPVNKIKVELKIPDFYIYRNYPNPQAAIGYAYEESEKKVEVAIRGRSGIGTADYDTTGRDRSNHGSSGYREKIFTLEEVNVPPLKNTGYVDNIDNYRAKTIWELAMTRTSGGVEKRYATTWDAVTKSIYDRDAFSEQINQSKYYQEDLDTALRGLTNLEEKMAAIFGLVKSKVTWNKYAGYFPENGVKKTYKEGKGNVADINLMLVSMLRYANLNADPVLVSTKNNGIPVFPTRYGFNYVIAQVRIGDKNYLLDATDPIAAIGLLPERVMNWQGRVVRPNGTSNWVSLYPAFVSNKLTYVQAEVSPDFTNIIVRTRLGAHYAKEFRNQNYNRSEAIQLKNLEKYNEVIAFSDLKIKDLETTKENITLSYKATATSIVDDINGDLYFSPMLFFAQKENPFKEETRTYPLFFDFPKSNKYNITIKIPDGYKIKSLPEAISVAMPGKIISYSYLISEANGSIQLAVTLDINKPALVADDYGYIKAIFSQIVEKENEKVVLFKI